MISQGTDAPSKFDSGVIEAQDALAFAYQYGYPLFAYGRFSRAHKDQPNNILIHHRNLVKAGWAEVVRPNNDTLYSFSFYDLSQHDLIVDVPQVDNRYWAFSFYDMYANNFANVGSQSSDEAGQYYLKFDKTAVSWSVRKGEKGEKCQGVIHSPTPYGIFLARINMLDDETDRQKVHGIQDAINLSPLSRAIGSLAPKFDRGVFERVVEDGSRPVPEAEQVLKLTAMLAPYNPPEVITDRGWVAELLYAAGIRDQQFVQPPNTSLERAIEAAGAAAQALRLTAGMTKYLGNNWRASSPLISGNFRSFYTARYFVAMRGYLQPTADQSMYPSWYPDSSTPKVGYPECSIGPNQALLFSFSGKPKLNSTGFWSLTLYGSDGLLVDNTINRYSLGDRSCLRYPDGAALTDRKDGKFEILVQPNDICPPSRYLDNWLPAPVGGGLISFTLRLFAPAAESMNGSYDFPKVSVIDAIQE